jgi:intein-encoded DNA endonuclease-like protein
MQNNNFKVNPHYLAGFFDGEGSMFVQIRHKAQCTLKFGIFYVLTFHQNNLAFNNPRALEPRGPRLRGPRLA